MVSIVNETWVGGLHFVQLEGRDRALWWRTDKPGGYKDGTAWDTDELDDIRKKVTDTEREAKEAARDYAKQIAGYREEVMILERLHGAASSYGNPRWFGQR